MKRPVKLLQLLAGQMSRIMSLCTFLLGCSRAWRPACWRRARWQEREVVPGGGGTVGRL